MSYNRDLAWALAAAMQAGPPALSGLRMRCTDLLGERPEWLSSLCQHVWQLYGSDIVRAPRRELARYIAEHSGFLSARSDGAAPPRIRHYPLLSPAWQGPAWLTLDSLPKLATAGALAEWLGITIGELGWFSACRDGVSSGPLHHYNYRWLPKRDGSWRLLEIPKQRLRAVQRQILHGILDQVPTHEAAHGFRRGRSILSYAAPHAGAEVVLSMDLRDFFVSVPAGRVYGVFHALGYPETVARHLTGLCCHATPAAILRQSAEKTGHSVLPPPDYRPFRARHLAQGAPTSPSLANLCAFRLDLRLAALAANLGGRYTRYADDLAFSGDNELRRARQRLRWQVIDIAAEEGFRVHAGKTRVMCAGVRQQLTGIVLNQHPNPPRPEYDRLKAILHNCLKHGPTSQNRNQHPDFRAHLAGRIAHMTQINPQRGAKLQQMFSRVIWVE